MALLSKFKIFLYRDLYMDSGISRRDFIYKCSRAFVGAMAFTTLSPTITMAGKAFAIIKKTEGIGTGGPFRDPPEMANRSVVDGIFEALMDVREATVSIGGRRANLFTYNGRFPSETIRLVRGDTLRLRLKNNLSKTGKKTLFGDRRHITNLHTHGWHVSPSGHSDNIFSKVLPGEEFKHEYDTSL